MPARIALRPKPNAASVKLTAVTKGELAAWLKRASGPHKRYADAMGFKGGAGETLALPGRDGKIERVLAGLPERESPDGSGLRFWSWAALPGKLPAGSYRLDPEPTDAEAATEVALAWALGGYAFDRYKKAPRKPAELVWPAKAVRASVAAMARADGIARDLINTPAEDMGPDALAEACVATAEELGMKASVIVGDDLLAKGFPLIHAVGRAAAKEPRLIDLVWGDPKHPKIAVIGKGVCFDTGGLDLKPEAGMKMMKKDMGGAAHALALARLIVEAKLPVRLRVLIPAVENSVSGNSIRPLDVVKSRKGITVEIGNTDAEGRLILADAMALAGEEAPELMVDFATLTGAARVALGPDLPALYANDDGLAHALLSAGVSARDPVWLMPLWQGYRARMESKVAELSSISDGPFAGSVTAALFLQNFVPEKCRWAHFDIFAWNPWNRPGRAEGAFLQAVRAVFAALEKSYPKA
jgi:leucyl aminopeptidase